MTERAANDVHGSPHDSARPVSRLALVIHSLSLGGAQRVLAGIASHWAEQGCQVHVITLGARQDDAFHLHPKVQRIALGLLSDSPHLWAGLRANWHRIVQLRRAIELARAEVVVSFLDKTNMLALLSTRRLRVPVIVTERTDPRQHAIGLGWSWLRRLTYPWSAAAVVQTDAVRATVEGLTGGRPVHVICNPAYPCAGPPLDPDACRPPRLISMGRLATEKGFDLLVEAFGQIAERHPQWQLDVYGEGPERARLEELAAARAPGRVRLPGWTSDPAAAYRQASIFVLPSRYEGFPNALLEAMACGLPAVSFDCPSGPAEIVRDGIDGSLVPPEDARALADALDRLMRDATLRRQLGARAPEVVKRFSVAKFHSDWHALLASVVSDAC